MPRNSARRLIIKARRLLKSKAKPPAAIAKISREARPRKKPPTGMLIEGLESRSYMSAAIVTQLGNVNANEGAADAVISTAGLFDDAALTGTIVSFNMNVGTVNVELYDSQTPLTVANFLNYATSGDYINSIIHRSIPGFVVQGGGFLRGLPPSKIVTDPPVQNEPGISNTRGTIAMAKISGDPNSATDQWFFNLANNNNPTDPQSLDNQNGGFTVFGHVIGTGMSVIDAIAALPRVPAANPLATIQNGTFKDAPLTGYTSGNIQLSNFVNVNSVTTVNKIAITGVASNNTNLVTATLDSNKNLVLHYLPRQTGSAIISLTATSADGSAVTETFTVNVAADPNEVAPIVMSGSTIKTVNYTDHDGTAVSIKFATTSNSTATLKFYGPGVTVQTTGSTTTVSGADVSLLSVAFAGDESLKSSFTVSANGGDGVATIETITGSTVLGKLAAPSVDLTGAGIVFTGTGDIGSIDLHDLLNGADIILPGGQPFAPYPGIAIKFDSSSAGSNITTSQAISSLTANKLGAGTITTAFIGKITVTADAKAAPSRGLDGSSDASFTLTGDGAPAKGGALASAKIAGEVSGVWNVTGASGVISVGSTDAQWNATFSSTLQSFATTLGQLSGSLTATSIASIKIKTNLATAHIILSGAFNSDPKSKALGSLSVGGNITNSTITGNGNFGAISAVSMTDSFIYTGLANVVPTAPPTSVSSFVNTASITSVSLKSSAADAFAGSYIAASSLGKIALKKIATDNGGPDFGVTADKIAAIAGVDATGKSFNLTKLDNPADLPAKLAGLTLGDFTLTLL